MSKMLLRVSLVLMLAIWLGLPAFTCPKCGNMGNAKLSIWVSEVANPCGTWEMKPGQARMTITVLDCKGVLHWACGRFLRPDGNWEPVPNGLYLNLPFECGHLEVEVPPGYYWVVGAYLVVPMPDINDIYFNKTTHVGIVQANCGETACVKLYTPTLRECWYWFKTGLLLERRLDIGKVQKIEKLIEEVMKDVPHLPAERPIEMVFDEFIKAAQQHQKQQK